MYFQPSRELWQFLQFEPIRIKINSLSSLEFNLNIDGSGPNMKSLNFYSVVNNVQLYNTEKNTNHPISLNQDVSRIQMAQIRARDKPFDVSDFDFMTDAVDPTSK